MPDQPLIPFDICVANVLKQEGGYADNPADPGGATNMGITRKTLAAWRKVNPWWTLNKTEVQNLTVAEAQAIYKAWFWDEIQGDKLPLGLANCLLDFAANSGVARAVISLQAVLGLAQDGVLGPITFAAISKKKPDALIRDLCDARLTFLKRLSTAATFGRAWSRRVGEVRAQSLALVASTPAPAGPGEPAPGPVPLPPAVHTAAPWGGALVVAGVGLLSGGLALGRGK
ncbi:MAG: glycosyl hydrolase 108 family protein [Nevskia sp.]|nr:glycosyl hydrolase 108 family protein [Nevskia sp.]